MSETVGRNPGADEPTTQPGEITERFQAFASASDPEPRRGRLIMWVGAGLLVLVVLVLVVVHR
jgi:hypothetical protein